MEGLNAYVEEIGKPEWRAMLRYVARLHEASTHPPRDPFPYPWEEIGPGYCYGPAFGHWDLVHQVLDVLPAAPDHARDQLLNNLAAQQADGLVPGSIWMSGEAPRWNQRAGHPPVWPVAVQAYIDAGGADDLIARCYGPLIRQIGWFEAHRQAEGGGFYYTDILDHTWESGIDEGVRFDAVQPGPYACVDATSHLYMLYAYGAAWGERLRRAEVDALRSRAAELGRFLRETLYDPESGFFYDIWAVRQPTLRRLAFEGMWPVVVGAATQAQADRVIDQYLLHPGRFFSAHPICTVGLDDPRFELRMWRGPTWNSMTYWAARGCMRYGRHDAARALLGRALDASAAQFACTGTVWEFYHPQGGDPELLQRKPHTQYNQPCRDYLGHNPLIAMAGMYDGTLGHTDQLGAT
ncbi:MAG: glycoside hydrolase [Anaerolineae bacterium]|nr:glycoside hydrolase [Anaerolineae bacterium]